MRRVRISLLVLPALLLAACASVPRSSSLTPSFAWPEPQQTRLGRAFACPEPDRPELSGVYLLGEPREAFRLRYELVERAERSLDLQYYLWKGDLTGQLLLDRVFAAADRGVAVRILVDDIYHARRDQLYAAVDAHPRVEVRVFNPTGTRRLGRSVNFLVHKGTLNHRMHNKIFLADNAAAILGGRNIGDDYFGVNPKLNFRDLDVLAVGPAARQAGTAFDLYWNSPAAVPITELARRIPTVRDLDELRARLDDSLRRRDAASYPVPGDGSASLGLAQLASRLVWADAEVVVDPLARFEGQVESELVRLQRLMASGARREMVVQTAYLIPSREDLGWMRELVDRGVRVRLLTNSLASNNHSAVHGHYRKYRRQLLRAGVELHELRADAALIEHLDETAFNLVDSRAGLHSKAWVVDGRRSLIASFNMDPRSRLLNSEIGLLVDSEAFASRVLAEMAVDFDPTNAYRVSLSADGSLRWTGSGPDGPMEWHREPIASFWRRLGARILGWLPIENEL